MSNNHRVYEHVFPNGKRYFGYTSRTLDERFGKDGAGYQNQPLIWNAIQKYGWDNITHNQIGSFADEQSAKQFETKCIRKYKTADPDYGYNIIECDGDRASKNVNLSSDYILFKNNKAYRRLRDLSCLSNYDFFDKRDGSFLWSDEATRHTVMDYNIGDLVVYHRFITNVFSGLIYASIYIDERTHIITRSEYEQYRDSKWFKFMTRARCRIKPEGDYFEAIQQKGFDLQNDPTEIIFSLVDGSYFISNKDEIDAVYHDNIERLLSLLNNEYKLHSDIKGYFEETKKYLCTTDAYIMRNYGKKITKLARELTKCNDITERKGIC